MAQGEPQLAFVHLDVRFMEGRTLEVKQILGQQMKAALMKWFRVEDELVEIQITVEIRDIERVGYFKYPEGTLTPI